MAGKVERACESTPPVQPSKLGDAVLVLVWAQERGQPIDVGGSPGMGDSAPGHGTEVADADDR